MVSPLLTGGGAGAGAVQRGEGVFGGVYPPGVYEVEGGLGGEQSGGARPARNVYEMW